MNSQFHEIIFKFLIHFFVGELGIGTISSGVTVPMVVQTSGYLNGKKIVAVSAGISSSMFLDENGGVYSAGRILFVVFISFILFLLKQLIFFVQSVKSKQSFPDSCANQRPRFTGCEDFEWITFQHPLDCWREAFWLWIQLIWFEFLFSRHYSSKFLNLQTGKLGLGDGIAGASNFTAVLIPSNVTISKFSVGMNYVQSLSTQNNNGYRELYAFGDNSMQQIGSVVSDQQTIPFLVNFKKKHNFTQISAGAFVTLALDANGTGLSKN